jgi:hypothetical protein
MALACISALCRLGYRLAEWRLRQKLVATDQAVPNQLKGRKNRRTMRCAVTCFEGLTLLTLPTSSGPHTLVNGLEPYLELVHGLLRPASAICSKPATDQAQWTHWPYLRRVSPYAAVRQGVSGPQAYAHPGVHETGRPACTAFRASVTGGTERPMLGLQAVDIASWLCRCAHTPRPTEQNLPTGLSRPSELASHLLGLIQHNRTKVAHRWSSD